MGNMIMRSGCMGNLSIRFYISIFFLNISSILKVQLVLRNPPLKIDQTSKTQGNCWALSKPIELKNKISFK